MYVPLLWGCPPQDRRRLIQGTLRVEVTVPETEWMPDLRRLDALSLSAFREGLADRMEGDYLKTYRSQRLVDDAISLAPLSADPLRETLGHFIQRSKEHFAARNDRLNQCLTEAGVGPRAIRVSPQLQTHVRWLVQFQLLGESYRHIAAQEGLHHSNGDVTVRKAVTEVGELIGLPIRRKERVGRPRSGHGK